MNSSPSESTDSVLVHDKSKKESNARYGYFEIGRERMGKTLNTMFDVKSAYPYGFGELKYSKPTFWDNVMESITEKRISLLDLGLIIAFMALLTTLTTILIGVFT